MNQTIEEHAEELAESFINGNRRAVATAITCQRTKAKAAALAVAVALRLGRTDSEILARRLSQWEN